MPVRDMRWCVRRNLIPRASIVLVNDVSGDMGLWMFSSSPYEKSTPGNRRLGETLS